MYGGNRISAHQVLLYQERVRGPHADSRTLIIERPSERLLDHRTKLSWAQAHLDALEAEVDAFLDGDPYEVRLKYDPKRSAYVATLYVHKTIPLERWGLMVGDTVHGIRSALDALMYSLWIADVGRKPTVDEVTSIQFVIADNDGFWERERKKRLRVVGPRLQKALDSVQPYRRKRPGFRDFLSVVRDLSNVDKHRHVLVVGEAATDAGITFTFPNGDIFRVRRMARTPRRQNRNCCRRFPRR